MAIAKGTTVYLPLASATQGAIMAEAECPGSLAEGTMVVFGGERGKGDAPDNACPGRKLAMGAMLGVVAALLDPGRIPAQTHRKSCVSGQSGSGAVVIGGPR